MNGPGHPHIGTPQFVQGKLHVYHHAARVKIKMWPNKQPQYLPESGFPQ
jgi:hypothetical protein